MIIGQIISQANRGILGSAFLLPKVVRGSFIVAFATLVMVFSLAIGPFVQQAIKTTDCTIPVLGTNASLPMARFIPRQLLYQTREDGSDYAFLAGAESELDNAIYASFTFSTIGMCSSCVDISPLVGPGVETTLNLFDINALNWSLPNGLSVSVHQPPYYDGSRLASVSTNSNFSWLGSFLGPELAQVDQWAVARVTSLAVSSAHCGATVTPQCPLLIPSFTGNSSAGPIAVACALYSCIRRTAPSITNNKPSEVPIDTSILLPALVDTLIDPSDWENITILDEMIQEDMVGANVSLGGNIFTTYAEVQLPCRFNETIYTIQNASAAPNATTLWLYETLSDGTSQIKNVSAPKACIYRQRAIFPVILAEILEKFLPQTCFGNSDTTGDVGNISNVGIAATGDRFETDRYVFAEVRVKPLDDLTQQPDKLLETDEMEAIAKSTMVRLRWDRGQEVETFRASTKENSTREKRRGRGWLNRGEGESVMEDVVFETKKLKTFREVLYEREKSKYEPDVLNTPQEVTL
ncbi:hypothetical protein V8E51_009783 [Hyaloscypha variabilis]